MSRENRLEALMAVFMIAAMLGTGGSQFTPSPPDEPGPSPG